jgi:hypothetical protein
MDGRVLVFGVVGVIAGAGMMGLRRERGSQLRTLLIPSNVLTIGQINRLPDGSRIFDARGTGQPWEKAEQWAGSKSSVWVNVTRKGKTGASRVFSEAFLEETSDTMYGRDSALLLSEAISITRIGPAKAKAGRGSPIRTGLKPRPRNVFEIEDPKDTPDDYIRWVQDFNTIDGGPPHWDDVLADDPPEGWPKSIVILARAADFIIKKKMGISDGIWHYTKTD